MPRYPRWDHCLHLFHKDACSANPKTILSWDEIQDRKLCNCPYWIRSESLDSDSFSYVPTKKELPKLEPIKVKEAEQLSFELE